MSVYVKGMVNEYGSEGGGRALFVTTGLYVLGYLSYLVWPYMALSPQGVFYFWSTFKALLPLSIVYLSVLQVTALAPTLISTVIGALVIVGSIGQLVAFLVGALVTGSYSFSGNDLSFFIYTCVLLVFEIVITALTLVVRTERRRHEQKYLRELELQIRRETGYDVYIPGSGSEYELRLRKPRGGLYRYRYRTVPQSGTAETQTLAEEQGPVEIPLESEQANLRLTTEGEAQREDQGAGVTARVNYLVGQAMRHLDARVERFYIQPASQATAVRAFLQRPAPGKPGSYNSARNWDGVL